jgi:hypothetical protein
MKKIKIGFLIAFLATITHAHAANFCGYQCSVSDLSAVVNELNQSESMRRTPRVCDPLSSYLDSAQEANPVIGARKLMATLYGSCEVLKQPVLFEDSQLSSSALRFSSSQQRFLGRRNAILATHPYLADRVSASCSDQLSCKLKNSAELGVCGEAACMSLQYPPVYQFGSRLKDHSVFERVRKHETAVLGIDDAAFISEAFAMKGLRIRPNQNIDQAQRRTGGLSNSEFWQLGASDATHPNADCFDRVISQSGVQVGDLIVAKQSHISMIDTVGEDPFGIQSLAARNSSSELKTALGSWLDEKGFVRAKLISEYDLNQLKNADLQKVLKKQQLTPELRVQYFDLLANAACETLIRKPEEYRVTLIHSSSRHGLAGVQREKLFPGLGDPGELSSQAGVFQLKVLADCERELRASWSKQANDDPSILDSKFASAVDALEKGDRSARILRHNTSRDGCRSAKDDRSLFEASECVRCCNTDISYQELVGDEAEGEQAE